MAPGKFYQHAEPNSKILILFTFKSNLFLGQFPVACCVSVHLFREVTRRYPEAARRKAIIDFGDLHACSVDLCVIKMAISFFRRIANRSLQLIEQNHTEKLPKAY